MADMRERVEQANQVLIGNYARQPVVMTRGVGAWLWDAEGKRYLDLFAGFGGAILGHCHPALVKAAQRQAHELWHVGNTFHTLPQIEVAQRLNRIAFTGQAFFCHSGAEANEAACKLARLRGGAETPRRWKIVTMTRSFHGRTLAMIAATGNRAVRAGFEPDVPGFINVEAGDFDALVAAVDDETAGVMLEPIQGEGGVQQYPSGFLTQVRKLCDERKLTLIFDEVWTGCGRTGRWFAHQLFAGPDGSKIEPDIMTLGKAIGGGLPVGVMFARPELAKLMVPGKHGSTLGGNAICMAVAQAVIDTIEQEKLLEHAANLGEKAVSKLRSDSRLQPRASEIRGRGLMLGIELKDPPKGMVERALERGLIINLTAQKVIRLAPPININEPDLGHGLDLLIDTIAS
jgi:acetylornithine/N-succinyldiaminopimelate aminotransferase